MKQQTKFKQTEIGEIPEDWEVKTLGEVSTIIDCLHSKKPEKQKSGKIYLEVFNLEPTTASIKADNVTYISEEDYKFWIKRTKPEYGDLVITNTGIVATAMIPKDFECCIGRNMTLIKPNKKILSPEYLKFYSLSRLFKQEMRRFSLSGTILESLHVKFMGKLRIALPPINEQLRIVENIKSFFEKGRLNNQMNKTLEAIGQALFKRWFVDFEFPNEKGKPYKSSGGKMVESELGMIPEGWRVSTIAKELKTILGGTPSREVKEYWINGTIPWINSGEINNFPIIDATEHISSLAVKKSATQLMPARTVVLPFVISINQEINISVLGIETCGNQSVLGIVEKENLPAEFIYYWINHMKEDIYSWATGGAQQHINKSNVDSTKVLIPKNRIMKSYSESIGPMFNLLIKNALESKNLAQIRDSLLPKLMSGKIRVNV